MARSRVGRPFRCHSLATIIATTSVSWYPSFLLIAAREEIRRSGLNSAGSKPLFTMVVGTLPRGKYRTRSASTCRGNREQDEFAARGVVVRSLKPETSSRAWGGDSGCCHQSGVRGFPMHRPELTKLDERY